MTKRNTPENTAPIVPTPAVHSNPEAYFFLMDQKLESLRDKTDQILNQVHGAELQNQQLEKQIGKELQNHTLELKELENQLQYLSHKTSLQIKEIENANSQFKRDVEARMQDIHFSTREELHSLSRRLEIIEKLIL
jgi:hypothetical protein